MHLPCHGHIIFILFWSKPRGKHSCDFGGCLSEGGVGARAPKKAGCSADDEDEGRKKVREWESKFTPLLFDIPAPSLSALLSYFPDCPTRKSTRGIPKVKLERQPIMYMSGRLSLCMGLFYFHTIHPFRGPNLPRSKLLPQ